MARFFACDKNGDSSSHARDSTGGRLKMVTAVIVAGYRL